MPEKFGLFGPFGLFRLQAAGQSAASVPNSPGVGYGMKREGSVALLGRMGDMEPIQSLNSTLSNPHT